MAKLYFRYGVMGSSKTANALMVRYNYEERGQEALLVKPEIDQRDGAKFVASRMGLSHPCIYFSEMRAIPEEELKKYACVIVDEAQFLSREEVQFLVHIVDDWNVPVICYGLRADFSGQLFPGSQELLATGRESRWCWGPTTSISACAASTGGRATWGLTSAHKKILFAAGLFSHLGREGLHGQEQPQTDALTEAVHPVGLDRIIFQILRPPVRMGTADEGKIELVHQK